MTDTVMIRRNGAVGHISLNRPEALNALTMRMCEDIASALLAWRNNDDVQVIIIDHETGRGFCAGGDVAAARESVLEEGGYQARDFFFTEYRVNHLIQSFPKPIITMMDGVTMGGGAGIAMPATYRVATENTLFAMPEGAIGLFPDAGAGYFLPLLPGQLGKFLALTGARLDGAECLWAGIATHYLPSTALAEAVAKIVAYPNDAGEVLSALGIAPPPARLERNAGRIDHLFSGDTLESILIALHQDQSEWAAKEYKAVASKCPASAKVALRLIAEGANRTDFAEEMALEYRIATRMIARPDFAEGVRAVLVDKDNAPRWQARYAEDVSDDEIEAIFARVSGEQVWTPFP